jgi:hypothetical protein
MPVINWIINLDNVKRLIEHNKELRQDIGKIYQLAVIGFEDVTEYQTHHLAFRFDQASITFLKLDLTARNDFRSYTACHLTAQKLISLFGTPETEKTIIGQSGDPTLAATSRNRAINTAIEALQSERQCIVSIKGYTISGDGHSFCLLKNEDNTVTTLEAWSTRGSEDGHPFLLSYYNGLLQHEREDYPTRSLHDTILSLNQILSDDLTTRTDGYKTLSSAYSSAARFEMVSALGSGEKHGDRKYHLIDVTVRQLRPQATVRDIIAARLIFLFEQGLFPRISRTQLESIIPSREPLIYAPVHSRPSSSDDSVGYTSPRSPHTPLSDASRSPTSSQTPSAPTLPKIDYQRFVELKTGGTALPLVVNILNPASKIGPQRIAQCQICNKQNTTGHTCVFCSKVICNTRCTRYLDVLRIGDANKTKKPCCKEEHLENCYAAYTSA